MEKQLDKNKIVQGNKFIFLKLLTAYPMISYSFFYKSQ